MAEEVTVSPLVCSLIADLVGESDCCPSKPNAPGHGFAIHTCAGCGKPVCGSHDWIDEDNKPFHAKCLQEKGKMSKGQKEWFGIK